MFSYQNNWWLFLFLSDTKQEIFNCRGRICIYLLSNSYITISKARKIGIHGKTSKIKSCCIKWLIENQIIKSEKIGREVRYSFSNDVISKSYEWKFTIMQSILHYENNKSY